MEYTCSELGMVMTTKKQKNNVIDGGSQSLGRLAVLADTEQKILKRINAIINEIRWNLFESIGNQSC